VCPPWIDKAVTTLSIRLNHPHCLCCTLLRVVAVFAVPALLIGVACGLVLGWAFQ
jgi:hypothetical protein